MVTRLFFALLVIGNYQSSFAQNVIWNLEMSIDSIKLLHVQLDKVANTPNAPNHFEALYLLARRYESEEKKDSSILLLKRIISATNPKPSKLVEPHAYLRLGILNKNYIGDINEATRCLEIALAGFEDLANKRQVVLALQFLAYIKIDHYNYVDALKLFSKIQLLLGEYYDPDLEVGNYNNLALLHTELGLTDIANSYLMNALEIINRDSNSISARYKYVIYSSVGELNITNDTALAYFDKSLSFSATHNDTAHLLLNRGKYFIKRHDYESALEIYESIIRDFKQMKDKQSFVWIALTAFTEAGKIYIESGDTELAHKYATEGLTIFNSYKREFPRTARHLFQLLSSTYESRGDFKEALLYSNKCRHILELEKIDQAKLVNQIHEFENTSKMNRSQIETLKVTIQQGNVIRNIIIFGSMFLSGLLITLWMQFQSKQKTMKQLEQSMNELRMAQQQLVTQEKLAALGTLTAGVAHEINNPLNFIFQSSIAIEERIRKIPTDELKELSLFFDAIKIGVKRLKDITNTLGIYSRSENFPPTLCNIHEIVDGCLKILNHSIGDRIHLSLNYSKNVPLIMANEGQLHQVFLNVLNNAIQAIKNEGTITIESMVVANKVVVVISDTGAGIEPSNMEKIFDPFFTTKDPGKGTGLGLSISYKIVKEHKGEIKVKSEINRGTTFSILLPLNLPLS